MAKVVGKDQKHIHRVSCKECAAIVEYVKQEVKTRVYSCMGDPSGDTYVECPNCKKPIVLSSW